MSDRDKRVLRFYSPPRPVVVDLAWIFIPPLKSKKDEDPIWIRAQGFNCSSRVPALQHAWILSAGGEWWALCSFSIHSSNSFQFLTAVTQLVRAAHIRPITSLLPENQRADAPGTPEQLGITMEHLSQNTHVKSHYFLDQRGDYDTPPIRQPPAKPL